MNCLECGGAVAELDAAHLAACCGLTLHEYALRHALPLELLVPRILLNANDDPQDYPRRLRSPGERARAVLRGLRLGGLLREEGPFALVPGEVRRLDLLLWTQAALADYGFRFRQEFRYDAQSHRVTGLSRLKALPGNLLEAVCPGAPVPPPDADLALAVWVAHAGELQGGYLFLPLAAGYDAVEGVAQIHRACGARFEVLESPAGALLRSRTPADGELLLARLAPRLQEMPGVLERFRAVTPEATVVKELVFDSAHFITDHPAKCSNLHGGRYVLQVKVRDRIDPVTGCVVDYGYLKRVVQARIIERFDHHHLNLTGPELAWRSSTEMLCVHIWEQIIGYLPALAEIVLYETPQSHCGYRGPSLAEIQERGGSALLHHFQDPALGHDAVRAQLLPVRQRGRMAQA